MELKLDFRERVGVELPLLIVLYGIETREYSYLHSGGLSFNRTLWN